MLILAIDLGKFQSQGCFYQAEEGSHEFVRVPSTPAGLQELMSRKKVDRVVIESCSMAGWIVDLAKAMDLEIQVANANGEAWLWRKIKNKSDKLDALKLARLSAMNQLSLVHVPEKEVRQWRALIQYRQKLVERRAAVCNAIGAILLSQGEPGPRHISRCTQQELLALQEMGRELRDCGKQELWRGQLLLELKLLQELVKLIEPVEQKLNELAQADERVKLLQSIPALGVRTAEMIVAWIDDPRRFGNGRQVGAYAGLTPRRYQSGQSDRSGRISHAGPGHLRKLLVQVAWMMLRYNEHGKRVFDGICHGQRTRRKQAAVALARRILVWSWAMLRDNRSWQPKPALSRGQVAA